VIKARELIGPARWRLIGTESMDASLKETREGQLDGSYPVGQTLAVAKLLLG
jgi:hypothetical protein